MKTAKEFYEYHNIKQPKKLLVREEFMFEKLNEDLEIVASANTNLSVNLAIEKVEKSEIQKSLSDITKLDTVINSTSHTALFFVGIAIALIGCITAYSNIIKSKDAEIDRLLDSNNEIKELKAELEKVRGENHSTAITGLGLGVLFGAGTVYFLKENNK